MAFGAAATALSGVAAIVVVIGAFSYFSLIPIVGIQAGELYADLAVLKPERCASLPGVLHAARVEPAKPKPRSSAATCAELVSPTGDVIARGRVVVARSSFAVFYRPAERDAVWMPMKDAMLRTIDTLPADSQNGRISIKNGR